MWTKMSGPPVSGVTKPWPFWRQKYFTFPVSVGLEAALSDVENVLFLLVMMGLGTWKKRPGDPCGERIGELLKCPADRVGTSRGADMVAEEQR